MKKLNLQLGSIKEMLTKEQMKKVAGGYDESCGGSVDIICSLMAYPGVPFQHYTCMTSTSCQPDLNFNTLDCLNGCTGTYGINCISCNY